VRDGFLIVLALVVVLVLETCVFSERFRITDELDLREHARFETSILLARALSTTRTRTIPAKTPLVAPRF
jgi:hypothetical protein